MVDESSIKYRLCSIIDQLWSINLKGGCPWAMSGDVRMVCRVYIFLMVVQYCCGVRGVR